MDCVNHHLKLGFGSEMKANTELSAEAGAAAICSPTHYVRWPTVGERHKNWLETKRAGKFTCAVNKT